MKRTNLARLLSIVGHPALAMPAAILLAATQAGAPEALRRVALGVALAIAGAVAAYSVVQVRAGRWAHVDASVPAERLQLNLVLVLLLALASVALWSRGAPSALVAGVGLSAAMVVVALACRRAMKLSLHCAFGTYAAALQWPMLVPLVAFVALAVVVAWSRLQLGRHTRAEVVAGLCLGTIAGVVLQWLAA